ncbi:MAG TPA: type II toxin-antitoxin system VapB family antitoxin [Stellaceae bacterium]|nr:type II toxin-antitoxin system VapB family antitoxin [Stellaceae bacterium]
MASPASLNLKSDEAYRLARRLSEHTGESMTKAVIAALRERLDRLERGSRESRVERILAIGRDCAAQLGEPHRSLDHGEFLYNKDGLPRDC